MVQGSTFRVKDKEGTKEPKFSLKYSFLQIIAKLAPNFGLSLTKLTLFSSIRISNAVQGGECNLEPLNL